MEDFNQARREAARIIMEHAARIDERRADAVRLCQDEVDTIRQAISPKDWPSLQGSVVSVVKAPAIETDQGVCGNVGLITAQYRKPGYVFPSGKEHLNALAEAVEVIKTKAEIYGGEEARREARFGVAGIVFTLSQDARTVSTLGRTVTPEVVGEISRYIRGEQP